MYMHMHFIRYGFVTTKPLVDDRCRVHWKEAFQLLLCLHPQVVAMLHGSQDYRFIAVEEFGIVSSYSPRTVAGDIQTMVNVSSHG